MTAVKSSKGGWKTIFHFLTKIFKNGQKTVKKGQKWPKMKIFRPKFLKKKFFFRIDSECFKTYFKPKKSISKIFSCWKFFSGTLPFFDENGHIVKIFDQICWNNFFSESIQNVSKRILNQKSWYRKNFLVEIFSGTLPFFRKWPHSENDTRGVCIRHSELGCSPENKLLEISKLYRVMPF